MDRGDVLVKVKGYATWGQAGRKAGKDNKNILALLWLAAWVIEWPVNKEE
jgi:hypothetical protein